MSLASISPCFIVAHLPTATSFYIEKLGFELAHAAPLPDPFFAIVSRDDVMLFLKAIAPDVPPLPNSRRHPWARWDAYIYVPNPDKLYEEYLSRGVTVTAPLADTDDGLRGFEIADADGYILFFGRPLTG